MHDKPRHHHDCHACRYLGRHGDADLYHCAIHGFPTVVARRGDGSANVVAITAEQVQRGYAYGPLLEAYRRALEMRLPLAPAA